MFGLFYIEARKEPEALLWDGKPYVAETGETAAREAKLCNEGDSFLTGYAKPSRKVQPRRLSDDAWHAREAGRFADGTYKHLPWDTSILPVTTQTLRHYPHISTVNGAQIAYTQDGAKGAGDIQTRVNPGRYLKQFYSDLFDAPTIARMAAEFSRDFGDDVELQFATTADDIERVYVDGPSSCMSKEAAYYDGGSHPVRVYAAGDLQLAYIERGGDITARALVWPAKMISTRIYGDETRLRSLLESSGYSNGSLTGAKIAKIEGDSGGYLMPYIDHQSGVSDRGDHFTIGGACYSCNETSGTTGTHACCSSCGDAADENYSYAGDDYCERCHCEMFGYCEHYGETCLADCMVTVYTIDRRGNTISENWSERAVDRDAFRCPIEDTYWDNDIGVTMANGDTWSPKAFEKQGAHCEATDEIYPIDELVQLENGTLWCVDHFQAHGATIDGKRYDKNDAPEGDDAESCDDLEAVVATTSNALVLA